MVSKLRNQLLLNKYKIAKRDNKNCMKYLSNLFKIGIIGLAITGSTINFANAQFDNNNTLNNGLDPNSSRIGSGTSSSGSRTNNSGIDTRPIGSDPMNNPSLDPPTDPGGPTDTGDGAAAPLDGAISVLLAIGIASGATKRKRK